MIWRATRACVCVCVEDELWCGELGQTRVVYISDAGGQFAGGTADRRAVRRADMRTCTPDSYSPTYLRNETRHFLGCSQR